MRRIKSFLLIFFLLFIALSTVVAILSFGYAKQYAPLLAKTKSLSLNRTEWQFPSRIYSNYREYTVGDVIVVSRFHKELELHDVPIIGGVHLREVDSIDYALSIGNGVVIDLPKFNYFDSYDNFGRTEIFLGRRNEIDSILSDGIQKESFRLPPVFMGLFLDDNLVLRTYTPLDSIGDNLINAMLSAEDRHFFRHYGFNPVSMFRATQKNIDERLIIQGGSTITQQLVKNLYFTPDRTFWRKFREIIVSIYLERNLSKKAILELYLNMIYVGYSQPYNICGVVEGSRFYFDKLPNELEIHEAALLASLIPAPSYFNPFRYPKRCIGRRNHVLNAMLEDGYISDEEYEFAIAQPVDVKNGISIVNRYRHFRDYLSRYATSNELDDLLHFSGTKVFTTIDPYTQYSAENALEDGVSYIDSIWRSSDAQGAIVVIENEDGFVRAIVGGRSDENDLFNRAIQAKRQPGSSFKIFVYLAAMDAPLWDNPLDITQSTILPDTLSVFAVEDSVDSIWRPRNYGGDYMGLIPVRRAFERSQNIATTYLTIMLTPQKVAEYAYLMGIESDVGQELSIGLGAKEVTPFEMTRATNTIACYGQKQEVKPIKYVIDYLGNTVFSPTSEKEQVMDSASVFLLINMLDGVVRYGRSYDLRQMGFLYPAFAKTGTSNNFRDSWFVGFTDRYTTSVWLGYDDGRSTGLTGTQAALPVWGHLNIDIHKGYSPTGYEPPENVEEAWICHDTGKLPARGCRMNVRAYYHTGTKPKTACYYGHDEIIIEEPSED